MNFVLEGHFYTHEKDFYGQVTFEVETGKIISVGDCAVRADKIFPEPFMIFPGMGDIHIHAREDVCGLHNYKESFESVSAAAINGGVVHVAEMPNNPEPPICDQSYEQKEKLTQKADVIVTLYAGIGPETKPLIRKVPYKAYMGPSVGDLFFKTNKELEDTLKYYVGCHVSFHCEDPEILEESKNQSTHMERRPRKAVNKAVDFALYLIRKYDLKGKLCHFSTGDGLDIVKKAKEEGVNVTVEVTPQQLYFDYNSMTEKEKPFLQMNPSFRHKTDKEQLLNALKDGTIDYLATDHAPHRICEKLRNFLPFKIQKKLSQLNILSEKEITELDDLAQRLYEDLEQENPKKFAELANKSGTSGIPQLDTYAGFTTWLMKEKQFTPQDIARVCSFNPGKFINQFQNEIPLGEIKKGFSASFTVIHPDKPQCISKKHLQTRCKWSPFEGQIFPGQVESVILKGKTLSKKK